jgi:hypothetical protein
MTTRDVVLIGTGAFVGFFLMGYFNKNKQASQEEIDQSSQSFDQAKLDFCIKKAEKTMQKIELSDRVNVEAYKQQLIADCMKARI